MSETRKSLFAAGGVALSALALIAGSALRDRVDLPSATDASANMNLSSLVASRSNEVDVPASDFYYELALKLKREYVEPVENDMKLASGSVRGMIGSLADPKSIYMDKDAFRAFLNARQGRYEGIGASFDLAMPTPGTRPSKEVLQPSNSEEGAGMESVPSDAEPNVPQIPRVMVTAVVPGGPADKAGVKPGDMVDAVDGHWVLNSDVLKRFRSAQRDFLAKKITLDQLNELRKELRTKYERAILPLRAKDKLFQGEQGTVKVVWSRAGKSLTTEIAKGVSQMPATTVNGNTIQLRFTEGASSALKAAIQGKDSVTIDLRNNVLGDFAMMREALATVAPKGEYGMYANQRKDDTNPGVLLSVSQGNPKPPKMTLLVDKTTRGAAEIFALALSSKGLASLSGGQMGGDRSVYDVVQLPDGDGFTLVTGEYQVKAIPSKSAGSKVAGSKSEVVKK